MAKQTRRSVLKLSGSVLGGIAVGSTAVAAESRDQYIIETRGKRSPDDAEIVHEMPGVDLAVVRGDEQTLRRSKAVKEFAADTVLRLEEPETPETLASEESNDLPNVDADLYDTLAWDKQAQDVRQAQTVTRGEGTRVSVIDDGVFAGHPDLNVNEELSQNFSPDTNGTGALFDDHGTHVAGTIAASDDGSGVVGTAPGTELVDLRVFSGDGASFGAILAAIAYAAAIDSDVANLSLGAYPIPRQGLGSFYGGALNKTMTFANKEGTLLVIAAGNDGADLQKDGDVISIPNEGAQGLSVAATGPEGYLLDDGDPDAPAESPAYYTNFGTNAVDLAAPGGDLDLEALARLQASDNDGDGDGELTPGELFNLIGDWVLSTTFTPVGEKETADLDGDGEADIVTGKPDEQVPGYGYKQGTSMAAPQVAGAAALVKSANPGYNANQVESALRRAASVPDGYDKRYYGSGFIDVVEALSE